MADVPGFCFCRKAKTRTHWQGAHGDAGSAADRKGARRQPARIDAPPPQGDYRSGHGSRESVEAAAKGKKWDRNGKRPDFEPRAPRTPATVEPPTLTALRTLLHHPELSQKVEDASHFAAEDNVYSQLLVALLEALQKNPKLRSLQLIARWHGTDQGRLL
nr:hypothetical protein [Tanacetum cinerariifolium]